MSHFLVFYGRIYEWNLNVDTTAVCSWCVCIGVCVSKRVRVHVRVCVNGCVCVCEGVCVNKNVTDLGSLVSVGPALPGKSNKDSSCISF